MLAIRLLGSQSVVDAATGAIATRSARSVELLAYLVLRTGVPCDRTVLAGAFWPDSTDAQALTNLRRELHSLRNLLGGRGADDSLQATATQLCWVDRGRHDIDLATFLDGVQRLAAAVGDDDVIADGLAALDAYGGPLLPALDEAWIEEPRRTLESRFATVCDLVASAARRVGRLDVAAAALGRHVAADPYAERAHQELMEVLAASGDRASAISTYHQLASRLERDLGVAPDPRTTRVLDGLLGSTSPDPGRMDGAATADVGLIARDGELESLLGAWRAASAGAAGVVVVEGGPGVGKSRLVAELASRVRRERGVVALSRCFDTTGRLSLAPVADWLRAPAVAAARDRLPAVWREEVDRLVPDTQNGPARADAATRGDRSEQGDTERDVWQRHRFFEGLARALLAPDRPLLLVLDNAQWSDPDTLSFVRFLLNVGREAPVLLAVTVRTTHSGAPTEADQWLTRLREEGLLTELALAPLDLAGTTSLAAALTRRPPAALAGDLLYAATGGFPLYVVEAVRSSLDLSRTGPRQGVGWMGILLKRIQQVSPAAREVAGLAAAVGRDFTIELVVEASDLGAGTVVTAVDELWRRRLIGGQDGRYDFTHDLLRRAGYESVTPARRWLLHRRLAQALELLWAGHIDAVASQIAQQYRLAGQYQRAVRYYRRAAQVAAAMYAHEEGLALLDAARELLLASAPAGRDRDEEELALLEQGIPAINARWGYSSPRLRQACERSVELADTLGLTARMVTAMVGLWASRFVEGRLVDSYEVAGRAVSLVRPGDARYGQAHLSVAGSALHLGLVDTALEHFRLAFDTMADEALVVGTRARVHTCAWWAHARWAAGDTAGALRMAEEATAEARASGHRYSVVVALAYEAITHQLVGHVDACADRADEVRFLCDRHQFTYYGGWGLVLGGWAEGGERGHRLIDQGIAGLRGQGARIRMPFWLSLLAQTTDDPTLARAVIAEARADAEERGERWWLPELLRLETTTRPVDERAPVLERALALAESAGCVALARRCRSDLDALAAARS
jgi:DNA-binding SARP family transcriptional activator/tetratricopeptide (TPR) repeat protein